MAKNISSPQRDHNRGEEGRTDSNPEERLGKIKKEAKGKASLFLRTINDPPLPNWRAKAGETRNYFRKCAEELGDLCEESSSDAKLKKKVSRFQEEVLGLVDLFDPVIISIDTGMFMKDVGWGTIKKNLRKGLKRFRWRT